MVLLNFLPYISAYVLRIQSLDTILELSVGATHAANLIFLICDLKTITCKTDSDFKSVKYWRIFYQFLTFLWFLATIGVSVYLALTQDYT